MQRENIVALQMTEYAEPRRPELHADTFCGLQDLNFGLNIKDVITTTSVTEAKPV